MPTDLRTEGHTFQFEDTVGERQRKNKGIVGMTVETPTSSSFSLKGKGPRLEEERPPARWKTLEFLFYGVAFVVVVPLMVWKPIQLSEASQPNYPLFERRLSPGWIFGRKVDNSDAQYRSFRNNIPALCGLVFSFFLIKSAYSLTALRSKASSYQPANVLYRIPFLSLFSILMLFGLHGASALKILVILFVNASISWTLRSSKLNPVATWLFNMGVLFANDRFEGYQFASISPALAYLDSIEGFYPRWHVSFNITMLRLISFNMDYYWACKSGSVDDTGLPLDHKNRTTIPHPLDVYSWMNYMSYILYPPLYIAGPIMTFNDFMWQHHRPTSIPSRNDVFKYFVRFVICLLVMEFTLHYMYVVAIKDSRAWMGYTAFDLSMVGFWNLIIVWMKLLLPWRFFRLWALADGVDPPENMVRCMANNYSTLAFWRSWHRSYSLWAIRYIYIPLGGSKNRIVATTLIFSFVALWHDLSFKLLAWGWLVSLFILPEVVAGLMVPASKYGDRPWYRHVAAAGAVFNVLMMMTANLVGFVIGVDGIKYMLGKLVGTLEGLTFLLSAFVCLFIAIQVMFEYREEEMRRGIFRKC